MASKPLFRMDSLQAADTSSIALRTVELSGAARACIAVLGDIHAELADTAVETGDPAVPGSADSAGGAPDAATEASMSVSGTSGGGAGAVAASGAATASDASQANSTSAEASPTRSGGALWAQAGRKAKAAGVAAGGFTDRAAEVTYARDRVADVFKRLQVFDACLLDLNRCVAFKECVPLVKSRHKQCVELLPIIAEVLKIQRSRAKILAERMARLQERMEAVEAARATEMEAHARAVERAEEARQTMKSTDAPPPRTRSGSDSSRSKRTNSSTSGSGSGGSGSGGSGSSSTSATNAQPADREQLKSKLRKSASQTPLRSAPACLEIIYRAAT